MSGTVSIYINDTATHQTLTQLVWLLQCIHTWALCKLLWFQLITYDLIGCALISPSCELLE